MGNFIFFEPCKDQNLFKTYEVIQNALSFVKVFHSFPESLEAKQSNWDIIQLQETRNIKVQEFSENVFGLRNLNRYKRLEILKQLDIPVLPFIDAQDAFEILRFPEEKIIVFKKDISSRGKGVRLIQLKNISKLSFKPGKDVLMEYNFWDSRTFKVDCFFTIPISVRVFDSFLEEQSGKFNVPTNYALLEPIPSEIIEIVNIVGKELYKHYCLYYSIDFMLSQHGFCVIEINTSEVARLDAWVINDKLYSEKIIIGIQQFWEFFKNKDLHLI